MSTLDLRRDESRSAAPFAAAVVCAGAIVVLLLGVARLDGLARPLDAKASPGAGVNEPKANSPHAKGAHR